jgi:tetratricopeptide (TPR) repeat protein
LECLRKARRRKLESFGNECRQILAKFKNQATGKNWNGYIAVYEQLLKHYQVNKNKEMVIKTYEEAIEYNPWNNNTCFYIDYLYQVAPDPIDKKTILKVETAMEKYKQAAGKLSSGMAHRKLYLKKRMGEDVFDDAIDYLKTFPNTVFGEIRDVIFIARDAISFDKPDQIKKYYNTLVVLAVKQPNAKENLATIGFILNEKKKIEAIMPDIK